jgi:hypothetical protein
MGHWRNFSPCYCFCCLDWVFFTRLPFLPPLLSVSPLPPGDHIEDCVHHHLHRGIIRLGRTSLPKADFFSGSKSSSAPYGASSPDHLLKRSLQQGGRRQDGGQGMLEVRMNLPPPMIPSIRLTIPLTIPHCLPDPWCAACPTPLLLRGQLLS